MNTLCATFVVPGRPISKNGMYIRRSMAGGGRGLRLSPQAKAYLTRIRAAAIRALGHKCCPFSGNVVLIVTAHFTRPSDAGATLALVQDALQGVAYRDDRCVVFAGSWRGTVDRYHPRTEVSIREISLAAAAGQRLIVVDNGQSSWENGWAETPSLPAGCDPNG